MTAHGVPPIALRNVLHGGSRSFAAIVGIAFVVTMVLLQLGFYGAVKRTAKNLFDELEFDIALISPYYDQIYDAGMIPIDRLRLAREVEGVAEVKPLYLVFAMWRCPPDPSVSDEDTHPGGSEGGLRGLNPFAFKPRTLQLRELLAIGIDLDKNPFRDPVRSTIDAARSELALSGRVLMNELSNSDFGWPRRNSVDHWEMNRHSVKIVGGFRLIRGFAADGAVICSDRTFLDDCPWPLRDRASIGLATVAKGREAEVLSRLRSQLPADVKAVSRGELLARETDFWVNQTSTGKIFAFGVFVAMLVASVVVYQVLSNDVRSRQSEYATLKAMGYTNSWLSSVVARQSMVYAAAAYPPAVLLSYLVYRATEALADIPMRMAIGDLLLAFGLAVLVSLGSAVLTLGKVRSAEPASLY